MELQYTNTKSINSLNEEDTFPLGRREGSGQFNHGFRSMRIGRSVKQFIQMMRRNNIYSEPHDFQISREETPKTTPKGWEINPTFQYVILILDIIFTVASYVTSTFEAFLSDYQDYRQNHQAVVVINVFAVVTFLTKAIVLLIAGDIENGVHYIYLIDIMKKQIKKGRFIVQISLPIIIIANMATSSTNQQVSQLGVAIFILCLLKIYYLSFSIQQVQIMLVNSLKKERCWSLLRVLVFNLLFAHFIASIFLAMLKMNPENNWYHTKVGITGHPSWIELYFWAYYWGSTTMLKAVFGDFVPSTIEEAMIVTSITILSTIVIAFNISQIGSIILLITADNQQLNSKIGLLRRMKRETAVSAELNHFMEEYLTQSATIEEEFQYAKHRQLIKTFPEQLQKRYYAETYLSVFTKLPFFRYFHNKTLAKLFQHFECKVYYQGDFIVHQEMLQQMYIILKGEVGFCYRKNGSSINKAVIQKVEVDYTKDQALVLAKKVFNKMEGVCFDIMATKSSCGLKLSVEKFLQILKQSEIDYHHYLMTRDMHQRQTLFVFYKCQYCQDAFHTKFQCPKLHFMPFNAIVIAKNKRLEDFSRQRRSKFQRQRRREKMQFNNENISNYLEELMNTFERKSTLPNREEKQMFQNEQLAWKDSQISTQFANIDKGTNFRHYFPSFNPEKPISTSLTQKHQNLNRRL